MGNKKATGFLCLRLVPCFAYVGAEDNRKGIPFVKIVSLLCKLIQFLMVALSVTVHKALILLVFLNHPYQSLAFMVAFGYPTHEAHIVPLTEETGVKYYLDGQKDYCVPKHSKEEIARYL